MLLSAELPRIAAAALRRKRAKCARERATDPSLTLARRPEVRAAHRDLGSSISAARALEKAAALAEANAKAQAEDYRLGQVTNLDVLGALNTLQQARLQLSRARLDAYWANVRLNVAAGLISGGSR